ncbi:putative secreted protein [Corynebacterium diphtheriae]|nr:putative secreted protein [Corynebacterium diphtheriae]
MKHYIKLPVLFTAAVFFVVACSTPSENESKPPSNNCGDCYANTH